mmetsp:Transcript_9378/g.15297  ORF Transcript_9378/g.15297 Transcript_9378/m.15297 type:complete len:314 (+) Transcript_9378:151-1092(+)
MSQDDWPEYQTNDSAGFIFGAVVAPVLVLGCVAWMVFRGERNNKGFKYAESANPKLVLVWRAIAVVYIAFALGYTIDKGGVWVLAYFTIWSYMLVLVYFIVGTCVSVVRVFYPHLVPSSMPACQSPQHVRFMFSTLQYIGAIEVSGSLMVAVVVWCYLAPFANPPWQGFVDYCSISEHALNAVFMFADFAVAGYLLNPNHWAIALAWPALYLCWHLAGNAAYGIMCYPFMKTDKTIFIAWVIALAVVSVLFFFAVYGLSVLKLRCISRYESLRQTPEPVAHASIRSIPRKGHEESEIVEEGIAQPQIAYNEKV